MRRTPEPRTSRRALRRYGIHDTVVALRRTDGAILVLRELAHEIEPSLAPTLKISLLRGNADVPKSSIAPKRRGGMSRRTASDTSGIGTPSPPGYFGNTSA